ncbi:trace amine-associated receptor 13c-like [Anguilla anguilla]|uniref:trace amine-associated receptor 13c-like n=1 Tax=Anguilla anguilla TaxID=7936 RepID=UPI0015AA0764|nr:trace amine-associated receptor 13c-like [Anguilla anguilla]
MNLTEEHQETPCVHSNFSCLQTSPTATEMLLYMSVAVVVSLTVCGNLLVIISICHFKQLQTPTNFLVLSLAMADFLVGVIVMPLYFTMWIDPWRCFDILYCTTFKVAAYYFTCISIYNVALITLDRYLALSNPFHYSMKMTVNVTLRMIAILWLYSLIYSMVLLYFNGDITDMKADITCGECSVTVNKVWAIVDFIIAFVLPCSMIVIINLKIFAIAKKHANKIRSVRKCPKNDHGSMASERKAAKSLGILVAVFLLCLVPYYVSAFVDIYFRNKSVHLAISITAPLVYLNSSINPIIYALFYPWFQRSVKLILTLRICGKESSILNVLERETL